MSGHTFGSVRLQDAALVAVVVAVLAIAALVVAEAFDVPVLVEPTERMRTPTVAAAALGVGLLVADVVAPVPSSLVMVAHGGLFGLLGGAGLSLAGRAGNAILAVLLGRAAGIALSRHSAPRPAGRAESLVERWGLAAVVVTRPVPVLAESTVVAAGAAGLRAPAVVVAATLGAIPEAVLYAAAGAISASFRNVAVVFGTVILIAGVVAIVGARIRGGHRHA